MDVSYFGAHGTFRCAWPCCWPRWRAARGSSVARDRPQAPPGRPQGCEAEAKDSSKADYREPATGRDL